MTKEELVKIILDEHIDITNLAAAVEQEKEERAAAFAEEKLKIDRDEIAAALATYIFDIKVNCKQPKLSFEEFNDWADYFLEYVEDLINWDEKGFIKVGGKTPVVKKSKLVQKAREMNPNLCTDADILRAFLNELDK